MQVQSFLETSAFRRPDKIALVTEVGRFTYAEIDETANKVANILKAEGVKRGERVAVYMDNSMEAVAGIFGILKADAVFTIINTSVKTAKLVHILNDCRAAAMISSDRKLPTITMSVGDIPSMKHILLAGKPCVLPRFLDGKVSWFSESIASADSRGLRSQGIDIDLAAIIYTSGSTGIPKGVMMSHRNMTTAADSITSYLKNTANDIILNTLPMSFDYGLYQVLMGFSVSATVILENTFAYFYRIIETIGREKVTGFPIVPTVAALLLRMDGAGRYDFPHLRYITNTAAALPVSHILRLREMFPSTKIYSMYGLTECKRVSYLPPEELDRRPESVGKAIPNSEAYIVDDSGHKVGPGVVGELVVRGGNVMLGYWEMPTETAKRLKKGRYPDERLLYTGDLFRMDDEGYLYFVGRKDDIIKSRGEKVSPREVENVIYRLDSVSEAVVVGVSDAILGSAVKAYVVPKRGSHLTGRDIIRFCSKHLEDYMIPKQVEFVDRLPKTASGKISKEELLETP